MNLRTFLVILTVAVFIAAKVFFALRPKTSLAVAAIPALLLILSSPAEAGAPKAAR